MADCLGRLRAWTATLNAPDDHVIGFEGVTEPVPDTEPLQFKQVGWRTLYLFGRAEVTGDSITDASIGQDQQNFGQYYVSLTFSPAGADRFEEITGANINRRFAIILDDIVDSAPVIRSKIGGGRAQITMGAGDPRSSCTTPSSSSWCCARAHCRRRSPRAASPSSDLLSGETPSARR